MRTEQWTENLDCELTERERYERGIELGAAHARMAEHEAHAAAVKADLKAAEKEVAADIARLAKVVHSNKELRSTVCWETADGERINVFREDTGDQVRWRPMDAAERKAWSQGELFELSQRVDGLRQAASELVADDGDGVRVTSITAASQEVKFDEPGNEPAAAGSEDAPNPMPGAGNFAPTDEDQANTKENRS